MRRKDRPLRPDPAGRVLGGKPVLPYQQYQAPSPQPSGEAAYSSACPAAESALGDAPKAVHQEEGHIWVYDQAVLARIEDGDVVQPRDEEDGEEVEWAGESGERTRSDEEEVLGSQPSYSHARSRQLQHNASW